MDATDASGHQVAQAARAPNVRYAVQPAEATQFPGGSFGLVTVAQALHWFDLPRFYAEVKRVLVPGGVLAAWGYTWTEIAPDIDAGMQRRLLPLLAPYWPPENRLLWAGYATLPFPFERLATPTFRIERAWSAEDFIAYVETWTATRRLVAQRGRDELAPAYDTLRAAWGPGPRPIAMPIHLLCGRNAG